MTAALKLTRTNDHFLQPDLRMIQKASCALMEYCFYLFLYKHD